MIALTTALIDYWHRLPSRPGKERRLELENARRQVKARELAPRVLVPYALADHDDEVVYAATRDFVAVGADGSATRVDDALQWIRRHLALNRGAVFAALLSLADEGVNERLAGLRLVLGADEVATVCRNVEPGHCERARVFLADWLELLAGGPASRQGEHIAAALGGGRTPLAA